MYCIIPNKLRDRKPIMAGLDYIWHERDCNIAFAAGSIGGAMRYAEKAIPKDLKRAGFRPVVFETREYYRINYTK